jgi:tol-pal system protein YbgF
VRNITVVIPFVIVAGCSSLAPADDPTYLRVQDIEARLIRIERVVNNQSLIDIASEIEQLRSEVRELRGNVESLTFETNGAADRQRQLYLDVDRRLQSLEQSQVREAPRPPVGGGFGNAGDPVGGDVAAPGGAPQPGGAAGGGEQATYDQAFALIQARRYDEAAAAFNSYLAANPNGRLADNAQYWLAETYYVRRDFQGALPEFQKVIDNFPRSAKLPDALLKVGYCNFEMQRWDAARSALQQVTRQYPDTTAARLAQQRLDRIGQEAG